MKDKLIPISQEQLEKIFKCFDNQLVFDCEKETNTAYFNGILALKKKASEKNSWLNTKLKDWLDVEPLFETRFLPVKCRMVKVKGFEDAVRPMPLESENIAEKIKAAMEEVLKPYEEDEENYRVECGQIIQGDLLAAGLSIKFKILVWRKETAKA